MSLSCPTSFRRMAGNPSTTPAYTRWRFGYCSAGEATSFRLWRALWSHAPPPAPRRLAPYWMPLTLPCSTFLRARSAKCSAFCKLVSFVVVIVGFTPYLILFRLGKLHLHLPANPHVPRTDQTFAPKAACGQPLEQLRRQPRRIRAEASPAYPQNGNICSILLQPPRRCQDDWAAGRSQKGGSPSDEPAMNQRLLRRIPAALRSQGSSDARSSRR